MVLDVSQLPYIMPLGDYSTRFIFYTEYQVEGDYMIIVKCGFAIKPKGTSKLM